jgi:integrase
VSTLVFASEKTGRAFNGWGKSVTALQRAAGVTFTPHDLRRTARTLMSRLGVAEDIAELAIGHVRADLIARYDKDEARVGRSDTFERVFAQVAALLGARAGAAVIPLRG